MSSAHYEFDPDTQSVIYQITENIAFTDTVAQALAAGGYKVKDEFHVTVLPRETGQTLTVAQFGRVALELESLPRLDYQIGHHLYEVSKPKVTDDGEFERQSLVAHVSTSNIFTLLHQLESAAGDDVTLLMPFTHLTVATRPDTTIAARGIGIASPAEWEQLQPRVFAEKWRAYE